MNDYVLYILSFSAVIIGITGVWHGLACLIYNDVIKDDVKLTYKQWVVLYNINQQKWKIDYAGYPYVVYLEEVPSIFDNDYVKYVNYKEHRYYMKTWYDMRKLKRVYCGLQETSTSKKNIEEILFLCEDVRKDALAQEEKANKELKENINKMAEMVNNV